MSHTSLFSQVDEPSSDGRASRRSMAFRAGALMAGAFLLVRGGAALSGGVSAWLITVGLTVIEVAALFYLDAAAERYHQLREEWRKSDREIRTKQSVASATSQAQNELRSTLDEAKEEIASIAERIHARKSLSFDLDEVCDVGVACAREAYLEELDRNAARRSGDVDVAA